MAAKLLIVDDHEGFRSFARQLFTSEGFEVTGTVPDGESVLDAVREQQPDLVLLDVQLPGIDGFEVASQIAESPGAPTVVLTSSRAASDYGSRLLRAPARGFIVKQQLSPEALAKTLTAP